jgi:hypothetical protein
MGRRFMSSLVIGGLALLPATGMAQIATDRSPALDVFEAVLLERRQDSPFGRTIMLDEQVVPWRAAAEDARTYLPDLWLADLKDRGVIAGSCGRRSACERSLEHNVVALYPIKSPSNGQMEVMVRTRGISGRYPETRGFNHLDLYRLEADDGRRWKVVEHRPFERALLIKDSPSHQ